MEDNDLIWKEAIEHVFKVNGPWDSKNDSDKFNVEYGEIQIPAKIVYKRAVDYLLENHPNNDIPSRMPGGVPTNQFIESHGFRIIEDLVYNNTEHKKFKDYYSNKVKNKDLFQDFIHFGNYLLTENEIDTYKVRMAIEASGDISIVVGMRSSYTYNESKGKSRIGFLVSKEFKKATEGQYRYVYDYDYRGEPQQDFVKIEIEDWEDIPEEVFKEHKEQFALQYDAIKDSKFTRWNVEANTTNSVIKYLMFEDENVVHFMKKIENNYHRPYFNLEMVKAYGQKVDTSYNAKSNEAKWFYDTREKLYYLVSLLSERLKEDFEIVYREKPNGQRGPGLIGFKDYILVGFVPKKYNIGDDLFMKIAFSNFKREAKLDINIDLNYRKKSSPFQKDRDKIFNSHYREWSLSRDFPDNWEDLVNMLEEPIRNLTKTFSSYFDHKQEGKEDPVDALDFVDHCVLNQILYGPPGTGKTYNTINKALEILKVDIPEKREEALESYNSFRENNQITFTTFHQSMIYEDFVEGIKPVLDADDYEAGDEVKYKIVSGLFKISCARAAYNCYLEAKKHSTDQAYSFDDLYQQFIDHYKKAKKKPTFKSLTGKETEIFEINKNDSIRARAKGSLATHVAPLTKENLQKLYDTFDSLDKIQNLGQIKEAVGVSPRITEFYAIFKGIKDFEKSGFQYSNIPQEEIIQDNAEDDDIIKKFDAGVFNKAVKAYAKSSSPVVLIIDEINRGNVSSIFGELITLIESDKRLGNAEAIYLKLPYSKKDFSVPANLHIIGTMNTADRSVEALDTALRRRFSFVEMPPDPQLIEKGEGKVEIDTINLRDLLITINKRIEKLLDKDHMIGHSYFMGINTLAELKQVFHNKVLPLLQEYFFGDNGKIGLVLGEKFFDPIENNDSDIFAPFNDYDSSGLMQRNVYHLKNVGKMSDGDFIGALLNVFPKDD